MQKTSSILPLFLLLVFPISSTLSAATFEVLFPIDYDYGQKNILVSDDGSTVLSLHGSEYKHDMHRWTESQGIVETYPRMADGGPSAMSGDGQPILAYSSRLAILDASYDGSVRAGALGGYPTGDAIVITPDHVYYPGKLPADTSSLASAVSADGKIAVGTSSGVLSGREAFRWTAETGMVPLGTLPGATRRASYAFGISPAGDAIVGKSASQNGLEEAYRWTADSGMQPLGDLPGSFYHSEAFATSNGGTRIVGLSSGNLGREAFLWDSSHGMRRLADVLTTDYSLNLQGLKLINATDISASGNVIVGWATDSSNNAFAFRANLIPEPSTLILLTAAITLLPLSRRLPRPPNRSAH